VKAPRVLAGSFLCLLLAVSVEADEGKLVLLGCDLLCRPGDDATLTVKVEEKGLGGKDARGARVSAFLVTPTARQLLAQAVADKNGQARIPLRFEEPGLYRVAVQAVAKGESRVPAERARGEEEFLAACRQLDRVAVVLDIDDTLTDSDNVLFRGSASARDPDTVAVVSALAEHYDLVYLTGRAHSSSRETRQWLRKAGLPAAPLFLRGGKEDENQSVGAYKAKVLNRLRRDFPNILIGVGDEDSDVGAYISNGMLAILLKETEWQSWNVSRWSQVKELLLGEDVTFRSSLSGTVTLQGRPWRFDCRKGDMGWTLSAGGEDLAQGSWPAVRSALLKHLRRSEVRP
jgi:hypothetical protein